MQIRLNYYQNETREYGYDSLLTHHIFLSNGGISNSGGQVVSVDKGDWDKISSFEEKHEFNRKWIRLAKEVLKPNGTIWVSGSLHNIYSVGMALEQERF